MCMDDDDWKGGDEEKPTQGVIAVKQRAGMERLFSFTEVHLYGNSKYDQTDKAETQGVYYPILRYNPLFQRWVDADGNGEIDIEEFKTFFNMSEEEAKKAFKETDQNHDGKLNREEFRTYQMKAFDIARVIILPKSIRKEHQQLSYSKQYSCLPPPIFMFSITVLEIAFFIYHAKRLLPQHGTIERYRPAPLDSRLIFSPIRRHEVWRFFTYCLVHSGYMHIVNNCVMQLVLGILLEMVHKWWRVLLIYFAGVLAGSLATSIAEPFNFLAGSSGGVYALITAHLSVVILNWSEMKYPWVRVVLFLLFTIYDVGMALYFSYVMKTSTNVGYAAHLGGAIAGLLTGIYVLKNIRWLKWEIVLWYCSGAAIALLILFGIAWNVLNPDHFPPIQYD